MRLKSLISRQGTAFTIPGMFNLIVTFWCHHVKLTYNSVQHVIWYFYYPVVSAQKPSGLVGSRKGHLSKESKALPRVHRGSTSPLFYAALTYTKAHVAMCDRALGGFPWLLISILTPLSRFLCGNKSHTKLHMWIYSWVRQEIRN